MIMKNDSIFQIIVENIDVVNSCLQFFAYLFPLFVIFIKCLYSFRAIELLGINLSKEDLNKLKYYVTTYGQKVPPIDTKEGNDKINLINFFIHDVFKKDQFGRYFIILADSGMGKSTFLQMVFLKYSRKIIRSKSIHFYPLSNKKDISEIRAIKNKYKSIILLDALDEDLYAIENYQKRIEEILVATEDFYKVIITCRTQFFPDECSEPNDIPLIKYGNGNKKLSFCKLYISAFTDNDIKKFLNKKYRWHKKQIDKAKIIISKSPDLMTRPMLLTYIDDLLDKNSDFIYITDIYEELIAKWLDREPADFELLNQFTRDVVKYMFENNLRALTQDIIHQLCKIDEVEIINPILARTRSLLVRNGSGEYKFAHYSLYEYLISYEAIYRDDTIREKILKLDKSFNKRYFYELSDKQLKNGNRDLRFLDFSGKKISEVNLKDADLYCSNLENSIFDKVNLSNAKLEKANLKNTKFINTTLKNAILYDACLIESDLKNSDLSGSKLCGADLRKADLEMSNLVNADLRGANLQEANLRNVEIKGVLIDKNGMQYILDNFNDILFGLKFTEQDKESDIENIQKTIKFIK